MNVLAAAAGATVRVVDVAVDCDPATVGTPPLVTKHKVRRGSGAIHLQDALTDVEVADRATVGTGAPTSGAGMCLTS